MDKTTGPLANTTRGLINRPGENNCFVNSVIQLLWHSDAFRRNFLRINFHTTCDEIIRMEEEHKATEVMVLAGPVELEPQEPEKEEPEVTVTATDKEQEGPEETSDGDNDAPMEPVVAAVSKREAESKRCMFCALQNLFIMFRYSDEATIPPTIVRKVMSDAFTEGEMHSALDCLEFVLARLREKKLYSLREEQLVKAESLLFNGDEEKLELDDDEKTEFLKTLEERRIDLVDTVFSHSFCEIRRCRCNATSEPFISKTVFLHLSVDNLIQIHSKEVAQIRERNKLLYSFIDITRDFGDIVRKSLTAGNFSCPEHGDTCGTNKVELENTLLEIPKTFCLTFNWVSEFTAKNVVSNILNIIQPELDLTKLFKFYPDINNSKDKIQTKYALSGAIAYYGKHYTVYVYHSRRQEWIYCDDHKIRVIGSWKRVVQHAVKNRHQIELLIYGSAKPDFIKV